MKQKKCNIDLVGRIFWDWIVISKSHKKYYWTCRCKCGCIKDIHYRSLLNNQSKSCRQCSIKYRKEKIEKNRIGKKFGRLTIIERDRSKTNSYFCKCECGNTKSIIYSQLVKGITTSCGCFRREVSRKNGYKYMKNLEATHIKYYKENTSVLSLQQKLSKNSTTKVKGVSKYKNGRYRAYINLRRKQIHLGFFKTIEEAQEARKEAEKVFFQPIIDRYKGE